MRHLARLTPHDAEGPIALAITAVEAREWDEARKALEPLLEGRLTQRVATLMARIEGEQNGHAGRVREWLARAVNAPRDPAWTADGVVADRWAPVSPVTGALDAFRWRVPVEEQGDALLAAKVGALAGLGIGTEPALEHPAAVKPAAAFPETQTVETIAQPAPVPAAPLPPPAPAVAAPAPTPPAPKTAEPSTGPKVAQVLPAAARVVPDISVAPTQPRTRPRDDTADLGEATVVPNIPAPSGPPRKPQPAPARARKAAEPKIFVPPRAPDDPGPEPEPAERVEDGLELGPFRPSGAKA
jgi:HemY protein